MPENANWYKVVLIAILGSFPLPFLFKGSTEGLSLNYYMALLGLSFMTIFFLIMIAVAIYVFITGKMEVDEEEGNYSADSAKESGKRESSKEEK